MIHNRPFRVISCQKQWNIFLILGYEALNHPFPGLISPLPIGSLFVAWIVSCKSLKYWMKFRRIQTKSIPVLIDEVRSWFWTCDQSRVPTCRLLMANCSRMSIGSNITQWFPEMDHLEYCGNNKRKEKSAELQHLQDLFPRTKSFFSQTEKYFSLLWTIPCTCRTP